VSTPGIKSGLRIRRATNLTILLFVFFLPLHFHAVTAGAAQITHECSCVHGTRTQVGITAAAGLWATSLGFVLLRSFESQIASQTQISFQSIRAPPVS
jgi:hypothetical protein